MCVCVCVYICSDLLRDYLAHPAIIDFVLEVIIVTKYVFGETVVVTATGQQTLGLQDVRILSLDLLPFRHYKPKLKLYRHESISIRRALLRTQNALLTTNGVISCCPLACSVHFTPSDIHVYSYQPDES